MFLFYVSSAGGEPILWSNPATTLRLFSTIISAFDCLNCWGCGPQIQTAMPYCIIVMRRGDVFQMQYTAAKHTKCTSSSVFTLLQDLCAKVSSNDIWVIGTAADYHWLRSFCSQPASPLTSHHRQHSYIVAARVLSQSVVDYHQHLQRMSVMNNPVSQFDVSRQPLLILQQQQQQAEPWIEIIEEPKPSAMRFRYLCEGRNAGTILGEWATAAKRTYPTIKVV